MWNADNSDFVFNVLVWDKLELAAFYQPCVCWNSKLTTVVTASVALGGGCHSSFHRGKDWSQMAQHLPPVPRLPAFLVSQVRPLPLLQPTAPLSLRLTPERDTHWTPASMYTAGSQEASKPQASPVSHQADTTPKRQGPHKWQAKCSPCVPNYFLNQFSVILSWLVDFSSLIGNPKVQVLERTSEKYWTCYL